MQELQHNVILAVVLGTLLVYPAIVSVEGITIVIAWVYGVLFARLATVGLQYAVLHWGVNRPGIVTLGGIVACMGAAIMYYAYTESIWLYMGVGWVVLYAGLVSAHSAYRRATGNIRWEIVRNLHYVLVALFVLAVLANHIEQSPLGQLGIEYRNLSGESLVVLALVITVCELVHHVGIQFQSRIEKILDR